MEVCISDDATLYDLRSVRGLTHQQVVDGIATFLNQEPKDWSASAQWDVRGVKDADILEALAKVLDFPYETIRRAALNSRNKGRPVGVRPGRKKAV